MASPLHRHTRSGSTGISSMRKPQNTKAAAQRLAQVMAHQPADDEEEEDDLLYGYDSAVPTAGIGLAGGRHSRNRSPLVQDHRQCLIQRTSSSLYQLAAVSSSPSPAKPVEPPPPSRHPSIADRSSQPIDSAEEAQPPSARANDAGRSPSHISSTEQPSSARFSSVGRPNLRVKTVSMVPPSVPLSIKPSVSGIPADSQPDKSRDKRLSPILELSSIKSLVASSLLLLYKMSSGWQKNGVRKQNQELGSSRSRKEAELQKREAALKVAAETYGGSGDEIAALRMEAELHDVEREVKSLRTMTQRMILTQEEMEEVVLKRCWLARCWSLCVRYGIHADIAGARHEYWSSLASRPVEVILAAGRKAKDENSAINNDLEEREKVLEAKDDISDKPNVESMLMVEKDELNLPIDGHNFPEAFELSPEESEDVLLKQAWLMYFWRRAKNQGLELDVAEERLQVWINQGNRPPTSHDAVDVERGMMELRKLGVETKLWEESRRLIDPDSAQKTLLETEYNILA
ncbi:hypothetical protein DH2020_011696 [Rehmannia glutinosa]|uniref:Coiled-coil domain-containing protein SCD2 n=1 Tax=Rehmannia glutinosa TaxID=99300 RepID=A0ABR0XE29_REHGL